MDERPARSDELWGDPAKLKSDILEINVSGDWKRDTGVFVQTDVGLPMTILSVMPEMNIGG